MFANKKCLVTGGSGMIGRKVIDILRGRSAFVYNASLPENNLTYFDTCKELTYEMDYVFHVAGLKGSPKMTHREKVADYFVPLLQMNTNILEACRLNKVKGVVYVSSIGAYASAEILKEDNPEDEPMDKFPGWAKRMGEYQIQAYKMQYGLDSYSIVRPTNTYGEGDRLDPKNAMIIPLLMAKIMRGDNPVKLYGDGSDVRDFAYSGDIARGIVLAMEYGTKGRVVNLGGYEPCSIRKLVETLHEFIDFNYGFDANIKSTGYPIRVLDKTLARELIHYEPQVNLREGLERTWKSYQQS